MALVSPEKWYVAFWVSGGLAFLGALYFVIKCAVRAALKSL